MKKSNVLKNIVMLYGFSIAKIIFPLVTLPYLTRVLSVETYGVVSYVKTVMTYMQLIVDFGFMLSGTKEIVLVKESKDKLSRAIGDILAARILLCVVSLFILCVLTFILPILHGNVLYTFLSYIPIALTVFLFDYVFRGLEKMQVITSRFVVMKSFSTILTFVLVKSDSDLLMIPILDTLGSVLAIILVAWEFKKQKIRIAFTGLRESVRKLKESGIFFASSIATTACGALNTILIGVYLNATDIAFWGLAIQIVNAVLAMYNPIIDGVYPNVVKTKDFKIIKRIAKIFIPIIICGCIFVAVFAKSIVTIAFGSKYEPVSPILIGLIPVMFFSFPAMLMGWPMLGAVSENKQVTITTIIYGCFNVLGLAWMILFNQFTLKNIVVLRSVSEFILFLSRGLMCLNYRALFSNGIGK